nr:rRNA-processing protein and EBNA1-binding protein ebp2 [Polyrhizophydium stewartii]
MEMGSMGGGWSPQNFAQIVPSDMGKKQRTQNAPATHASGAAGRPGKPGNPGKPGKAGKKAVAAPPELNPRDTEFDVASFIESQALEVDDDVARLLDADARPDAMLAAGAAAGATGKKRKRAAAAAVAAAAAAAPTAAKAQKAAANGAASDDEDEDEDQDDDEALLVEAGAEDMNSEEEREMELYMEMMQHHKPEQTDLSEKPLTEKEYANKKEALLARLQDIQLDPRMPWVETQALTSTKAAQDSIDDVHDDLKRELAFYEQALESAQKGRAMLVKAGIPFSRPTDYFAEMVKTDEHMARVRQRLIDEAESIKASELARKQREIKKFGKKVQQEKLAERERAKKESLEQIKLARKKSASVQNSAGDAGLESLFDDVESEKKPKAAKRGGGGGGAGDSGEDDFGVSVDKDQRPAHRSASGGKRNFKREKKDSKFGFGGKKSGIKRNTADSTDDFTGSALKRMKGGHVSKKGGGGREMKKYWPVIHE